MTKESSKKPESGEKRNSPSREDQMIIAQKPVATYIYVLKKLLEKHDKIDLSGGSGLGNSKVI